MLDRVAAVWDGSVETFEAAWDVIEYDPQLDLRIADMRFTFAPSLHYTTCYSIKIEAGRSTIAYSADTAPTERLARFAQGADLFLCEASLKDAKGDSTERGHRDAAEAGREASRASVKRLLLTHVPAENGSDEVIEKARAEYTGPIEIAQPGLRIEV